MQVSLRTQQTRQERIRDIRSQDLVPEVTLEHNKGTSDHCDCHWLYYYINVFIHDAQRKMNTALRNAGANVEK